LSLGVVPEDYLEPVAADWPDLLEIVERKVKPTRMNDNRENYSRYWWQFAERRRGLERAMAEREFAFVVSWISIHIAITKMDRRSVPANSLVVFPSDSLERFAVLQSRVHEVWARMMASSMKDDLRYGPTDCFETFPFPVLPTAKAELEALGKSYYHFRADLMVARNQGLTSLYNDFHDQLKQEEMRELQRRHDEMDRAVLAAYGWNEPVPECQFFEENPSEDEEEEPAAPKKKKFRYRWPDDFRDEILARLLLLNQERAKAEAKAKRKGKPIPDQPLFLRKKPSKDSQEQMSLL
jgi:hypothetical protein